jgi:hypothetical protein
MVTNAANSNNKRDANNSSNMVTPPTAKRHQSGGAEASQNKNSSSLSSSSSVDQVAIQGGASPVAIKKSTIPLPKYEERTKVGQVVVAYPSNRTNTQDDRNTKMGARCVITSNDNDVGKYNVTKPYRHMFTTMEDRAMALEKMLVDRKEAIINYHGLSTEPVSSSNDNTEDPDAHDDDDLQGVFAPMEEVNVARQEKITCLGRICNEVSSRNNVGLREIIL